MRLGRLLLLAGCASACARAEPARSSAAAAPAGANSAPSWRQPGDKIDSILPMPEYVRRFRAGLTEPRSLSGGAGGREALARRFLAAVSAHDTAALVSLLITRAEFAWLVFPDHLYASPPYELDPEIFWLQVTSESAKGLGRALQRLGGRHLTFQALDCRRDTLQIRSGPVRVWAACGLRYGDGGRVQTRRLFGSVIERDGRFKLMSVANDF